MNVLIYGTRIFGQVTVCFLAVASLATLYGVFAPAHGQWTKHEIDLNLPNATVTCVADIDSDGDLDVVASAWSVDDVVWYENGGNNLTWTKHTIDGNVHDVIGVHIADIDRDDTLDVVVAAYGISAVIWYENRGGVPIVWEKHSIDGYLNGATWLNAADIDGDTHLDVVATGGTYTAGSVVWYQNDGGVPISWTTRIIDASLVDARQARLADLDGDMDVDVVAAGFYTDDVLWYENGGGVPISWTEHIIDDNLDGAISVSVGDVDGDGDLDVAAVGELASEVVWYENSKLAWIKHPIANLNTTRHVALADIDVDMDLDVIATSYTDNDVVWFVNQLPSPDWPKETVDAELGGARIFAAVDMDRDTDPDLVVLGQSANDVVWYENRVREITIPGTMWAKVFGGSQSDVGVEVQPTLDGGYVIIGNTESFGAGEGDMWLIKTDADGDTVWTRTIGGASQDWGSAVQQTIDSGYVLIGGTSSFGNPGDYDIWLIKTDANGDTMWTRTIGGEAGDEGTSVTQTADGGYAIVGVLNFNHWDYAEACLIKTDEHGDIEWIKTDTSHGMGGMGCVRQIPGGGFIIGGSHYNGNDYEVCLTKTDSFGNILWVKTYGKPIGLCYAIQETADGGYVVVGSSYNYALLIKVDANGDTLWTRTYGGPDNAEGMDVKQAADGGYVIAGRRGNDVWLIKTDADGDTVYTQTFGGGALDIGRSVQVTTDGDYIICGETASFGAGGSDVLLLKVQAPVTSVDGGSPVPAGTYYLRQNYPNPFNPVTTIQYQLPRRSHVTLRIYNTLGQEVTTLVNKLEEPGDKSVRWNAVGVASGVYFYRLQIDGFVQTRKLVVLR